MAIELSVNVYGLTDSGKKVKIGKIKDTFEAVGGPIFYIDDTADGVYEFFDREGNLLQSVNVGDRPYAYRVVGAGTRDKYYVYHDEMYTSKRWTYYKDGAYVYDVADSLGLGIGSGKTNTAMMMARDNGAYVTANSNGMPTIWYQLQQTRLAKAGDCDDWFVPSRSEMEELRKAIGFQVVKTTDNPVILPAGKVTGGVIAGAADGQAHYHDYPEGSTRTCYPSDTKFLNNHIWSSSAGPRWGSSVDSEDLGACYWDSYGQRWDSHQEHVDFSVFFVRAF